MPNTYFAFPSGDFTGVEPTGGMLLVDYFAIQIVAAMIQAYASLPEPITPMNIEGDVLAASGYLVAQSMMDARKELA